ncbi:Bromodomain and PHD finger-containing protein 3, partial [Zancudomyces culisetae]
HPTTTTSSSPSLSSPSDPPKPNPSLDATMRVFDPHAPVLNKFVFDKLLAHLASSVPSYSKHSSQWSHFATLLSRYWALKKRQRHGAPLLKRLHIEPWPNSLNSPPPLLPSDPDQMAAANAIRSHLSQLRSILHLVLLREQLKLQLLNNTAKSIFGFASPLRQLMIDAIYFLKDKDKQDSFWNPVSQDDAPDYYRLIDRPMCLQTVLDNVINCRYLSLDQFHSDLNLIWANCMRYNEPRSYHHNLAKRFRKMTTDLINEISQNDVVLSTSNPDDPSSFFPLGAYPSNSKYERKLSDSQLLTVNQSLHSQWASLINSIALNFDISIPISSTLTPPPKNTLVNTALGSNSDNPNMNTTLSPAVDGENLQSDTSKNITENIQPHSESSVKSANNKSDNSSVPALVFPDKSRLVNSVYRQSSSSQNSKNKARDKKRSSNPPNPNFTLLRTLRNLIITAPPSTLPTTTNTSTSVNSTSTVDNESVIKSDIQLLKSLLDENNTENLKNSTNINGRTLRSREAKPQPLPDTTPKVEQPVEIENHEINVVEKKEKEKEKEKEKATSPIIHFYRPKSKKIDGVYSLPNSSPAIFTTPPESWSVGTPVWALMQSFPWYPAEIYDGKSKDVPKQVHEDKAKQQKATGNDVFVLVYFYDNVVLPSDVPDAQKKRRPRTWKWLAPYRLLRLGVDPELDEQLKKARISRNSAMKKQIQLAYQQARNS